MFNSMCAFLFRFRLFAWCRGWVGLLAKLLMWFLLSSKSHAQHALVMIVAVTKLDSNKASLSSCSKKIIHFISGQSSKTIFWFLWLTLPFSLFLSLSECVKFLHGFSSWLKGSRSAMWEVWEISWIAYLESFLVKCLNCTSWLTCKIGWACSSIWHFLLLYSMCVCAHILTLSQISLTLTKHFVQVSLSVHTLAELIYP